MGSISLLYKNSYPINDRISIAIPRVGEIIDYGEDEYYGAVAGLTAMPIDMMVQLDDIGVDFTQINEYDLFVMLFSGMKSQDMHLIFGDLDLSRFQLGVNQQNGMFIFRDEERDITIDRAIHGKIATVLRRIHRIEKDRHKPANEAAKDYMLERARAKLKRQRNKQKESQLESHIVALVNTEQFKYDYESVRDLTIYQFNESLMQIVQKVDYDNRMFGVYSGTINAKELRQEDLNWLTHK